MRNPRSPERTGIDEAYRAPEVEHVSQLLSAALLPHDDLARVRLEAHRLIMALRKKRARASGVDALMHEFSLSSDEGVALMCLAEALLRIPDTGTRDVLIRDKIGPGSWDSHLGRSPSLFVNAATWGLLITGKLVATHNSAALYSAVTRLITRGGEPLIRKAVDLAMRLLGRQFVMGETIGQAIANGRENASRGYRYSYDMLGEAAVTDEDALRYLASYEHAIRAIGKYADELGLDRARRIQEGPGISVKLSALHPRYAPFQRARVMSELLPRLKGLAVLARQYQIGLSIDAEESERLDLSLDLFERLAIDEDLGQWDGLGFVVQAYQKRAPKVIDFLVGLARRSRGSSAKRIMIRLVKGAYWDSEIKRAQQDGLDDYPVYTRKRHTDLSYQACARQLLAHIDVVYPQFATHNAYTLAWVRQAARGLGRDGRDYEFQCLHGMGESLYDQIVGATEGDDQIACRIYAPVGIHATLLAYLVRRLLENGANSSFVNRIVDETVSIDALLIDPAQRLIEHGITSHTLIPKPANLFDRSRHNSLGLDWSNTTVLNATLADLDSFRNKTWKAEPILASETSQLAPVQTLYEPADRTMTIGTLCPASNTDIELAIQAACAAVSGFAAISAPDRASLLRNCALTIEKARMELFSLLIREAGKTLLSAVAEVREAVDFCRYYATQIEAEPDWICSPAPPVVCISPWNFPLAIFTGQIAAALAAGRTVLAKPAEQTPLVAALAVKLFHEAGVDKAVLQYLPGDGETVGARLVSHPGIGAVLFTGSTHVAQLIARQTATSSNESILVAETGGQNAMIVDSSALTEQVVQDVLMSAFDSAGQRCSALRVLYLQDDIADATLEMLFGAMRELRIGRPSLVCTDIGPVIDEQARAALEQHIADMGDRGFRITRASLTNDCNDGTFVAPTVIEIESMGDIDAEVFGPILHVVRFRFGEIEQVISEINSSGYGLTMGVHSRIDEYIDRAVTLGQAGNIYVNRNMIGAVVGVQPFGGRSLSGTGPKAGGPLFLARLGGPLGFELHDWAASKASPRLATLREALSGITEFPAEVTQRLQMLCDAARDASLLGYSTSLAGPTGETNTLQLLPRGRVAILADSRTNSVAQLVIAVACGSQVYALTDAIPAALRQWFEPLSHEISVDALIISGANETIRAWRSRLADQPGPITAVFYFSPWDRVRTQLALLSHEKTISVNTAAAGGNASLMTLTD